jgi:benzoyl-CoA 2,3-dioxygenase component B
MQPQYEPGEFATWIAPPTRGIDQKPTEFEYVMLP